MDNEKLKERTKNFAHRCVKLAFELPKSNLGDHIRKQIIRCSTSVAANYRAAVLAQTKAAFISKISIVVEEADESEFWLEFIMDEKLMKKEKVLPLYTEAHELSSIFSNEAPNSFVLGYAKLFHESILPYLSTTILIKFFIESLEVISSLITSA